MNERENEVLLKKISKDLNINFHEDEIQDWGIINSDPNRVMEFIDYFDNNFVTKHMQIFVFELIIASYNDAIIDEIYSEEIEKRFLQIIDKSYQNNKLQIIRDYWAKIYDQEEFPVGKYFDPV